MDAPDQSSNTEATSDKVSTESLDRVADHPIPPANSSYKPKKNDAHYTTSWGTILILVLILSGIAFLDSYAYNQDVYDQHVYEERHSLFANIVGDGYTQHVVTAGNTNFYVSFDPHAKMTPPSQTISYTTLEGNDLRGEKMLVEVSASSPPSSDNPCSSLFSNSTVLGNVVVLNGAYPLCGENETNTTSKNSSVGVSFRSDGQWYSIVFTMATNIPVDINSAKTIAQSIIL